VDDAGCGVFFLCDASGFAVFAEEESLWFAVDIGGDLDGELGWNGGGRYSGASKVVSLVHSSRATGGSSYLSAMAMSEYFILAEWFILICFWLKFAQLFQFKDRIHSLNVLLRHSKSLCSYLARQGCSGIFCLPYDVELINVDPKQTGTER